MASVAGVNQSTAAEPPAAIPHHDNVPTRSPEQKPLAARLEDQRNYLVALRCVTHLLNEAGIGKNDYMVMAGGSVFLYELSMGAKPEVARAPTDLDIVLRQTSSSARATSDLASQTLSFQRGSFSSLRLITEPRIHFGYKITNPIIEACVSSNAGITNQHNPGKQHFDVDLIPGVMSTTFPKDHAIKELAGLPYQYPTNRVDLFQAGPLVNIDRICKSAGLAFPNIGEVRLASPAFVAFYKVAMLRDSLGKQDSPDIRRMHELGLIDLKDEGFVNGIRLMASSHPDPKCHASLTRGILQRIARITE